MAVFSVKRGLYCYIIFAQKLFLSFPNSAILFLVVLTSRSESGIMKSRSYCIYVFVRIGLNFILNYSLFGVLSDGSDRKMNR